MNAIHVSLLREKQLNPEYRDALTKLGVGRPEVRELAEKLLAQGPEALTSDGENADSFRCGNGAVAASAGVDTAVEGAGGMVADGDSEIRAVSVVAIEVRRQSDRSGSRTSLLRISKLGFFRISGTSGFVVSTHFFASETSCAGIGFATGYEAGSGCGSMVECGLPKAETRVRFPSPAPTSRSANRINCLLHFLTFKNPKVRITALKSCDFPRKNEVFSKQRMRRTLEMF